MAEPIESVNRWRIENLRTIIRTHINFIDTESFQGLEIAKDNEKYRVQIRGFDELRDYIENCNEEINSIRTVLNDKERSVFNVVYFLDELVTLKVDIWKDYRRHRRSSYDKEFDEAEEKIQFLERKYQLLSSQLEQLARFSLKAIDVLQEHKTAARSFLTVLLLKKSQSITNSLYATVNPRGPYGEHMLNAGMNEEEDEDDEDNDEY